MQSHVSWYAGKRVLVTGHTGFKGSWLTAWLKQLGAHVTGFSLAPVAGEPSLFNAAGIADGMTSVIGDIRDRAALAHVIREQRPEIVFHLAAQALVRRSYADPVETYATNVMGTVHLLEELRHSPGVRSIVVITSDKCYANHDWDWGYRESDELGGHDPYSNSKACAELVAGAYRSSFFAADRNRRVGLATARAGNVIGGGDWSTDRIVPDIVRALAQGRPVGLRNPDAVRPWQHVLEPVRGYLQLGERLWHDAEGTAGAWNFGPRAEDAVTVINLTERFLAEWGGGAIEVTAQPNALHEARVLRLDCSKAARGLGWTPVTTLNDTIQMTAGWYRAVVHDPSSAAATTERQIRAFRELVGQPQSVRAVPRPVGSAAETIAERVTVFAGADLR